jgi:hypothetical protein
MHRSLAAIHTGHDERAFKIARPASTQGGFRMAYATLLTGANIQPLLWALLTSDHSEVSFRVILGLAVIAAVWIAAGLWLIHVGESKRRIHR